MQTRHDRHPWTDTERLQLADLHRHLELLGKQGVVPVDVLVADAKASSLKTKHDVNLHTAGRIAGRLKERTLEHARALSEIALVHPDEAAFIRFRDHFEMTPMTTAEKAELWLRHPELTYRTTHSPASRITFAEWVQRMNKEGLVHGAFRPATELVRWTLATKDITVAKKVVEARPRTYTRAMALSAIAAVTGEQADLSAAKAMLDEVNLDEMTEAAVWYLNAARDRAAVQRAKNVLGAAKHSMDPEALALLALQAMEIVTEIPGRYRYSDTVPFMVLAERVPYYRARAELVLFRHFDGEHVDGVTIQLDGPLADDPAKHDEIRCLLAVELAKKDEPHVVESAWSWLQNMKRPHVPSLELVQAHCAIYAARKRLGQIET